MELVVVQRLPHRGDARTELPSQFDFLDLFPGFYRETVDGFPYSFMHAVRQTAVPFEFGQVIILLAGHFF